MKWNEIDSKVRDVKRHMELEVHQGDRGIKNATECDKQVIQQTSYQISNKVSRVVSLLVGIYAKFHVPPYKIPHNMLAPKCRYFLLSPTENF